MDNIKSIPLLQDFSLITPDFITTLQPNQVFVFGTDSRGSQRYGAAGTAYRLFGAKRGISEGMTGHSYAIATKDESYENVYSAVQRFLMYARHNPHLNFLVTPIGCGHAGFCIELVAPMFVDALGMTNVYLPKVFIDFYKNSNNISSKSTPQNKDGGNGQSIANMEELLEFIIETLSKNGIESKRDFELKDSSGGTIAEAAIGIESLKIVGNPINSYSHRCFTNIGYTVVELKDIIRIINESKN
ncbi:MAG: hypothetical protein HDS27_07900 [Bacteroides sp.]|nr:hypothetical protein [Bacteroides sp.]